jgi:hypothetical protein
VRESQRREMGDDEEKIQRKTKKMKEGREKKESFFFVPP